MYWIAITLAKLLNWFIQTFKLGAGFTWPGHLALYLDNALLCKGSLYPKKGLIFVSATNGKTTTTKLISHILLKSGYSVLTNTSGANLLNGIASALLLDTDFRGKAKSEVGVFEVDEFALANLLKYKSPDVLVLLNLSRDQLDRYGETDIILDKWVNAISKLPASSHLVLDATQPVLAPLAKNFQGAVDYFDMSGFKSSNTILNGTFITKNVNAALQAVTAFDIKPADALKTLSDFQFAWGRGETLQYNSKAWTVLLAKNPASFNFNLDELAASSLSHFKHVLIIFNDNIPDGRDVSWIYDILADKLFDALNGKRIFVSGLRAYDMAVRLMYAGISVQPDDINTDLPSMLTKVSATDAKEILVLPNYSAMLNFRKLVLGRSIL